MSKEQKEYILNSKKEKILIILIQVIMVCFTLGMWELLSSYEIINPFIFSKPSKVINEIYNLYLNNNLFIHIWISVYETLIAFVISLVISFIVSILLYLSNTLFRIFDPFLTILNSLPKVALGPMIIIMVGANVRSVIVMAILINVIVSIVVITNGFYSTDKIRIKLMNSFGATRIQILKYLVIPSSIKTIISSFKLSISMCMIGLLPPVGEN